MTEKCVPRTDLELRQLAMDYLAGAIFTDHHVPEEELAQELPGIFLPLALAMDPEFLATMVEGDFCMVFEYMNKAGDRTINGYPQFLSCQFLPREEYRKFLNYVIELKQWQEPAAETEEGKEPQ